MRTEEEIREYLEDLDRGDYQSEGEQAATEVLKWVLGEGEKW